MDDILKEKKREIFQTYTSYGKTSKQFHELATKFGLTSKEMDSYCATYAAYYATPEEKIAYERRKEEAHKAILKYVFDFCIVNGFSDKSLQKISQSLKKDPSEIRTMAKAYLNKYGVAADEQKYRYAYQKYDDEKGIQHQQEILNRTIDAKYNIIFNNLMEINDDSAVIEYLKNMEIKDVSYFRTKIFNYTLLRKQDLGESEKQDIKNHLQKCLDVYNEYLIRIKKEEKQEEDYIDDYLMLIPQEQRQYFKSEGLTLLDKTCILEKAQQIITDFIVGDYPNREVYCKKYNIENAYFKSCLQLIQKYDHSLGERYLAFIAKQKSQRFAILTSMIKQMVVNMRNGILVNEEITREFDLLDYYLTTKLDFDELLEISKEICNAAELKTIKAFIYKNKEQKKLDINQLYASKHIINKDNKQYEVTKEDKEIVINYLKQNNIPLYHRTYNLALRRYLADQLIEKEDEKSEAKGK